ncbi:MAG: hypothetical protein R2771_15805 [Saprospiraceae bacterium]
MQHRGSDGASFDNPIDVSSYQDAYLYFVVSDPAGVEVNTI